MADNSFYTTILSSLSEFEEMDQLENRMNNECRIARTKYRYFLSSRPPRTILEFRSLSLAYAWPMRRDVDPKWVFENQANLMDMF